MTAMNYQTAALRIASGTAPVSAPSPRTRLALMLAGILLACSSLAGEQDLGPVTERPWQEVVVSVSHIDRTARFFVGIGGYEAKWRGPLDSALGAAWGLPREASGEALLLGPADYESGLIRLVRFDNAGERRPMRPGSRAWDTGCYFSMMVRMKDMPEIYRRAIDLGWWTGTPPMTSSLACWVSVPITRATRSWRQSPPPRRWAFH